MRLRNDKKQLQERCNIFLQRNLHLDQLVSIVFQTSILWTCLEFNSSPTEFFTCVRYLAPLDDGNDFCWVLLIFHSGYMMRTVVSIQD